MGWEEVSTVKVTVSVSDLEVGFVEQLAKWCDRLGRLVTPNEAGTFFLRLSAALYDVARERRLLDSEDAEAILDGVEVPVDLAPLIDAADIVDGDDSGDDDGAA